MQGKLSQAITIVCRVNVPHMVILINASDILNPKMLLKISKCLLSLKKEFFFFF